MQAPDTFWGLTGTGWAAIGSIVSAASVVALVILNWRFVYLAREQAEASIEQATMARNTLETLKEQISSDLALQRHTAIAVLREVMSQVMFWGAHFRTEVRSEQNPIQLVPDDWNTLVAYVSRYFPDSSSDITAASMGLRNVEVELNRLTTVPLHQRAPNISLQVRQNGLGTNLGNVGKLLKEISDALTKQVIPKS